MDESSKQHMVKRLFKAVCNIEAILSVPGIEVAFIVPYDRTSSMGITAQFDNPDYLTARDAILAACQRHRVVPGIHVVPPDTVQSKVRIAEGYRFLAYSLDITMLTTTCTEGLAALRKTPA